MLSAVVTIERMLYRILYRTHSLYTECCLLLCPVERILYQTHIYIQAYETGTA